MSRWKSLQRIAHDWAMRSFGKEHVINVPERGLRALEESIELAQALGVPRETALLCVQTVYDKPVGNPMQEGGGALMTLAILCHELRWDAMELLEAEVRRVLNKPQHEWAMRNQAKLDLGLKV